MLQTGLDKNWTAAEYGAAAQRLKLAPAQLPTPGTGMPDSIPIYTITVNMNRAAFENRPAKRASQIARNLFTRFTQDRDALRAALNASLSTLSQE
jgi:hypothetical protein